MKTVQKIGFRSLRKNRSTSLMTILTVALSVAMTTMVVALFFGIIRNYEHEVLNTTEQYNVKIHRVKDPDAILNRMQESIDYVDIDSEAYNIQFEEGEDSPASSIIAYITNVNYETGYKKLPRDVQLEFNSYDAMLASGRLPQNQHEIAISAYEAEEFNVEVGNTYRSIVFEEWTEPSQEGHERQRVYGADVTIVGIFMENAYYAKTSTTGYPYQVSDMAIAFKPGTKNIETLIQENLQPSDFADENSIADITKQYVDYKSEYNTILGMQFELSETKLVLGTASLVFILILLVATFSMIYNAFNNNVEKQMHNYGLIRSIGATKRQLRGMISVEGYLLGGVGIALGIGAGYGIAYLLSSYLNNRIDSVYAGSFAYRFDAYIPLVGYLFIVVIAAIIVTIPLHRAISRMFKMTSIESIRESKRYKDSKKRRLSLLGWMMIKSPEGKLAQKYTHTDSGKFKGVKMSLAISIVIFIALMSFIKIGFSVAERYDTGTHNLEVSLSRTEITSFSDINSLANKVKEDLKQGNQPIDSFGVKSSLSLAVTESDLSPKKFVPALESLFDDKRYPGIFITTINDDAFQELAKSYGVTPESSADGILMNHYASRRDDAHKYEGPIYDMSKNPILHVGFLENESFEQIGDVNEVQEIRIIHEIDTLPDNVLGNNYTDSTPLGSIIMSHKIYEDMTIEYPNRGNTLRHGEIQVVALIQAQDSFQAEDYLKELGYHVRNLDREFANARAIESTMQNVLYAILIFISGICVLNVVSLTASNLNERRAELAALRSVGMSQRSIEKMLLWESVAIMIKPVIWGSIIGLGLSYVFVYAVNTVNQQTLFVFSIDGKAVAISWILTLVIVIVNLVVSVAQSRKQKIVEDMRRF
ncbi:ABC transporter permease [Erysipelothrix anatis]|uniref:ABC transporter permease n=1 Tax=Erysipelothrix anatis TaxID=2683713 RepID=UPI00140BCD02|nr:FtsX-like permease family protein [Erysipelothrix anatis]